MQSDVDNIMFSQTRAGDPLEQEIAAVEAAIARDQALFAIDGHLIDLKQRLEMSVIELNSLKRAAELRPLVSSPAGSAITQSDAPQSPGSTQGLRWFGRAPSETRH